VMYTGWERVVGKWSQISPSFKKNKKSKVHAMRLVMLCMPQVLSSLRELDDDTRQETCKKKKRRKKKPETFRWGCRLHACKGVITKKMEGGGTRQKNADMSDG
jgi:hypothetical protein